MSLASAKIVNFPLQVELGDRPDIVLESAGRTIGIELMELVPACLCARSSNCESREPNSNR